MLLVFCHIEVKFNQTIAKHSISIVIFMEVWMTSDNLEQLTCTEWTFCMQEAKIKNVFYMYSPLPTILRIWLANKTVYFDQAKFKNTSRHCCCCLNYHNCEQLCVNIEVMLKQCVAWEIKRKYKTLISHVEERKEAVQINSKLREFYFGFNRDSSCNHQVFKHVIAWEIKRKYKTLISHVKKRKEAVQINSKLPEFYFSFNRDSSCNHQVFNKCTSKSPHLPHAGVGKPLQDMAWVTFIVTQMSSAYFITTCLLTAFETWHFKRKFKLCLILCYINRRIIFCGIV